MTREEIMQLNTDYLNGCESEHKMNELFNYVLELQKNERMVGSWIKSRDSYGNNHFTCPFCEHDIATKADTLGDNYCSNCGAKLQESEPQESEDKG